MADLIARDGGREHGGRGPLTPGKRYSLTPLGMRYGGGWGGGGGVVEILRNSKLETVQSAIIIILTLS